MGRRLAVAALFVAAGGAVALSVSTSSQATTSPPVKTTTPPPGTTVAPSTTLWPATTAVPTSTLVAPQTTTFPPQTTDLPTQTTSFPPPTAATFDAFTLLRDFYGQLAVDPFVAADHIEQTARGSAAEAFLFHEVGVAIAIFGNTSAPLPAYTVTANGPAVSVCRDDGVCESFSDFIVDGALLDTFSIDGQPMDQRISGYERPTTVEALTIDAAFAVRRPRDELLSVVVLLTAAGGGTTFAWEQAMYVDASGRQYPVDQPTSQYPVRIEDGDLDVAHVSFAGAQHGGQLVIPITTDQTGVATTIRIPIIVRR